MITCFPYPYHGEIFYSTCARYSERMKYRNLKAVSRDLFDCSNAVATIAFPCHLSYLVNNLPPRHGYSIDRLIDEHTLFPYFRPFLPQDRLLRMREAMSGEKGASAYSRSGVTTCNIPLPTTEQLRFCPICINEDRNQGKEYYWHRIHQIPGIEVCPTHKVFLCKIRSDAPGYDSRLKFLSAERAEYPSVPITIDTSDFFQAALLDIALDIAWIMHQHDWSCDQAFFKQRYHMLLTERGLARQQSRGQFDVQSILQEFKVYYPAHLLRTLSCDLAEHETNNWLYRLLCEKDRFIHPLYHLLLIHFLGHTIETFVNIPIPINQGPFGDGPWPCLNPASPHYRQKVVSHCSILPSKSEGKKPRGVFSCGCGFVYSRYGPDTRGTDIFKIRKILSVGSVWEETFVELWRDPTISLEEIARRLALKRDALQCHAARLGLPLPRPGCIVREPIRRLKVHLQGGSIIVETRENYRAVWLKMIQENPEISLKAFKQQNPKAHYWLYRYDRSWLKASRPQRRKQKHLRKPRVDWNDRDKKTAAEVTVIASQIRSSEDMIEQVTRAAILKRMGKGVSLKQYLAHGKLPLTRQVLDSLVDSSEEFVIRRIWWMKDVYLHEKHIMPKRSLFARQTGAVDYLSSPNVREAFEAALQSLEAFFLPRIYTG